MSNEKIYRTISHSGGASLALGIVVLVTGIVSGVLMIVTGAKLLKQNIRLLFRKKVARVRGSRGKKRSER